MAFTLIDIFRKPFDPAEYHDRYREALAELIEAKLEGKQVVSAPARRETRVIDLADALKRSVEAAKKEAATKPKPPARARTRASRPAKRTRKVG
jgi:DNA end-binding protein Ku